MQFALTLEMVILLLFGLLFAYAVFTVKRFIDRMDKLGKELSIHMTKCHVRRETCLVEFANQEDVAALFAKTNALDREVASATQWMRSHENLHTR